MSCDVPQNEHFKEHTREITSLPAVNKVKLSAAAGFDDAAANGRSADRLSRCTLKVEEFIAAAFLNNPHAHLFT